jgi:hypothetical protein
VSVYLYALVANPLSAPLGCGMSGEPLRVVDCGRLLAVVGDMQEPPALTPEALREHDRTIRRMSAMTDAVLPVRFGSLVDREDDVLGRLEPLAPLLEAALARVAGSEQMTLRVYETARSSPAAPQVAADLGPGARYLIERRRTTGGHHARSAVRDTVLPALASFIRAERLEPHDTPPLVASIHHLIERGQSEAYAATLHAAAARLDGTTVSVSGPWPPYAFASEEIG